jgi:plasmid maintenance system killer protein
MIKSFRHKGLKAYFENGNKRGISPDLATRIGRRLDVLNAALRLGDVDAHGFDLHRLKAKDKKSGRFRLAATGELHFDLQRVMFSISI